ncbi:MAG: hypothetical protein HOQ21_09855 [Dermatophilaceae bacterium]|nr:hypothetical protein [Dermatophilaceae bacterium]
MMTEPNTRSGTSTAAIVFAAAAFALTLIGYSTGSGLAILFCIIASVAGLVLGIVVKREAAITISAVTLLVGLAIGFGIMPVMR